MRERSQGGSRLCKITDCCYFAGFAGCGFADLVGCGFAGCPVGCFAGCSVDCFADCSAGCFAGFDLSSFNHLHIRYGAPVMREYT